MPTLSKIEEKILKKVADAQLITNMELKSFLQNNGSSGRDPSQIVDSVTRSLIDKKFLTAINPVGSTCFIITQKGARLLSDMELK